MELDLEHLVRISVPVLFGFARVEPRKWGLNGIILELLTEIGSLGRALTIWEGYRHGRKSRHQLGDELSDIFFVLLKLTRDLKIELPPIVEVAEVKSPEETHFRLMQLATEVIEVKNNTSLPLPQIQKIIQEMIMLVGGLAAYYRLSLNQIHEEEMWLAAFWQKIFFDAGGRKAKRFVFWRKVIWYFVVRWHERIVERL